MPSGKSWGTTRKRSTEVFHHWQLRADAEVRRSANEYMDAWLDNPEDPTLLHFGTPEDARKFIDFNVAQLRHVTSELRK